MRNFIIATCNTGLEFTWLPDRNVLKPLKDRGAIDVAPLNRRVISLLPYTLRRLSTDTEMHVAAFGVGTSTRYAWWGQGEPETVLANYYRMCQIAHCQPVISSN